MKKRAFTLIEMLVAVAIIALLAAILLPSLRTARAEARRAVCLSNLRQLGIATHMYLDANHDYFWREMLKVSRGGKYEGDLWWFGLEPGGPPSNVIKTRNRPLDKKRAPLARFLNSVDDGLQCPAFPYDAGVYFPKFAGRSASYGYNSQLGPRNARLPVHRRLDHMHETAAMFVFADAVLYDFFPDQRINEGYFLYPISEQMVANTPWGYGHFRHSGKANVLYLDGHCEPQPLRGIAYTGVQAAGPAGRLTDPAGGDSIFGKQVR